MMTAVNSDGSGLLAYGAEIATDAALPLAIVRDRLWTFADLTAELWLDAADSDTITAVSGALSQWNDKSGNERHLSQAISDSRPEYVSNVQNGLAVVRFDGTNDRLDTAAFLPNSFSVFVVAKKRDLSNVNMGWASQNNSTGSLGRTIFYTERTTGSAIGALQIGTFASRTGTPTGAFSQWGTTRNGASAYVYRDGDSGGAITVGSATVQSTTFSVGASNNTGSDYSDHDIAEILVVSGVVDSTTRQKIEGYLAHKWGLEANLPSDHPYRYAAPTVQYLPTLVDQDGVVPVFWTEGTDVDVDGLASLSWLLSGVAGAQGPIAVVASVAADAAALAAWIITGMQGDGLSVLTWAEQHGADQMMSLAAQARVVADATGPAEWGAHVRANGSLALSYAALVEREQAAALSYAALVEREQAAALSWLSQAAADGRLALALGLRAGMISEVRLNSRFRAELMQAIERRIDLALRARSARIY